MGRANSACFFKSSNFDVHLGGSLSFTFVVVRMQGQSHVIAKELDSPALLFLSKAKYSVRDLFFSMLENFLFFIHRFTAEGFL